MQLRLHLALLLLAFPAAAADVPAAGYSCQFTRYCAALAPCVVLENPMAMDLDPSYSGYRALVDGRELSEDPFRVVIDPADGTGLFLAGEQAWADGNTRWLLSIRVDGTAMMTIHQTRSFGEIETRTGFCRGLE